MHTGIAIFTAIIDLEGNINVNVRVDKRITSQLNIPGEFKGTINNSENIGKTSQDIAVHWDADHPTNLIEDYPPSAN